MSARIEVGQLGIAGLDTMPSKSKRVLPGRDRLTRKERRKASGPSPFPHRCVVLGIDAAKSSGWAILNAGVFVLAGTAVDDALRDQVCRKAIDVAAGAGLPLVVVGERWVLGVRMSPDALARLGGRWQQWEDKLVCLGHPQRMFRRCYTSEWRSQVLGKGHKQKGVKPDWKGICVRWALGAFKVQLQHDAAEALAMAVWGSRAPHVAELLPAVKS